MANDFGIREDLLPQVPAVEWLRGLNTGPGTDSVRIAIDDAADQLGDVMTVILADGTSGLLADILQTIKSQGASGLTGVGTYANLLAITPVPAAGTLVQVGNDPDPLKRGTYRKDAAGPDGWVKTVTLEDLLAIEVADHETRIDAIEPLSLAILIEAATRIAGVDFVARFVTPAVGAVPGRVMGGFGADMFWHLFKGMNIPGTGGGKVMKSTDPNEAFAVIAGNSRFILRKTVDGSGDLGLGSSTALSTAGLGADIIHIILYGQSLGEGAEALPLVDVGDTGHNGKRFIRGVRTFKLDAYANDPVARPASEFAVVPLTEVVDGAAGETSATGTVAMLKELLTGPNSPISRAGSPEILVTFAGRGGRYLDELKKTPITPDAAGKYYDTTIDDVRRGKAYADGKQKTYAVLGVMWWQGEANNSLQRSRGGPVLSYPDAVNFYRDDLIQLADDLHNDITAITHQKGRIPFWTYQTGGTVIGQAQLNAAKKEPTKVFMLGPTWPVPSAVNSVYLSGGVPAQPSDVHLTADGEAWAGCNYGKGIYRHVAQQEQTLAVTPLFAIKVDATTIDVVFAVPRPPLRLDTTFWPARGTDMGFKVQYGSMIDGDTAPLTYTAGPAISSVQVVDSDRVRLKLAGALSPPVGKPITVTFGTDRIAATLAGAVVSWVDGATLPNGLASKVLTLTGAIPGVVTQLLSEGAFYVQNQSQGTGKTWIARSVSLVGGNTTLLGAARDVPAPITPATAFVAGNIVNVARIMPYGNLFDDDRAKAPLAFRDATYGTRQGLSYPLNNPACSFQDLEVQV